MIEVLIILGVAVAIYYNFKSLIACATAELLEASIAEIFKIVVNIAVIIYIYGK